MKILSSIIILMFTLTPHAFSNEQADSKVTYKFGNCLGSKISLVWAEVGYIECSDIFMSKDGVDTKIEREPVTIRSVGGGFAFNILLYQAQGKKDIAMECSFDKEVKNFDHRGAYASVGGFNPGAIIGNPNVENYGAGATGQISTHCRSLMAAVGLLQYDATAGIIAITDKSKLKDFVEDFGPTEL